MTAVILSLLISAPLTTSLPELPPERVITTGHKTHFGLRTGYGDTRHYYSIPKPRPLRDERRDPLSIRIFGAFGLLSLPAIDYNTYRRMTR